MRLGIVAAAAGVLGLFVQEAFSEFALSGRRQERPFAAGVSTQACSWSSNNSALASTAVMDTYFAGEKSKGKANAPQHRTSTLAAATGGAATAAGAARAEEASEEAGTAGKAPVAERAARFERGGAVVTPTCRNGKGMPSVTLKLAMDRNGAVDDMAEGPKRFTSQASLDAVHRIRRDCGAVLVGVGTVVRDDPSLTVRRVPLNEGRTKQPTRVVLDRTLRLTGGQPGQRSCAILRDGHSSLIFYAAGSAETEVRAAQFEADVRRSRAAVSSEKAEAVASHKTSSTIDFVRLPARCPGAGVDLSAVLEALFERGIDHVLVEGGPSVARGFLSERLVDRAIIIRAPMEFSRPVPSDISTDTLRRAGLELVGCTKWEDDEAECWIRTGLKWPGGAVGNWP